MRKYMVRQAIKDIDQNIFGYEFLFQSDEEDLYGEKGSKAGADVIVDFLEHNNKKIFEDKIAFITFSPNLLFRNIPKIFDEQRVVIQIDDNVIVHPKSYELLQGYREQNYMIAVNDFQFSPRHFAILGITDYVRLNFADMENAKTNYENIIRTVKGFQKKCIAYSVDTREAYELACKMGVDYLEGTYLDDKITDEVNRIDFIKSNFFQLVVEITKPDPSLAEIEAIISRDVTLTYTILKLVNSVYFALRNKTTSIMQALVILGLNRLKQWVYLLSFRQDEENLREDLIKVSFLRANFCAELLHYVQSISITKSDAYLMGMFSTLGIIMSMPLEDALAEVQISDEIKEALINQSGQCGLLYKLVLSYEKADWKKINECAEQLEIPKDELSRIYFNCMDRVNNIWASLMNAYDGVA